MDRLTGAAEWTPSNSAGGGGVDKLTSSMAGMNVGAGEWKPAAVTGAPEWQPPGGGSTASTPGRAAPPSGYGGYGGYVASQQPGPSAAYTQSGSAREQYGGRGQHFGAQGGYGHTQPQHQQYGRQQPYGHGAYPHQEEGYGYSPYPQPYPPQAGYAAAPYNDAPGDDAGSVGTHGDDARAIREELNREFLRDSGIREGSAAWHEALEDLRRVDEEEARGVGGGAGEGTSDVDAAWEAYQRETDRAGDDGGVAEGGGTPRREGGAGTARGAVPGAAVVSQPAPLASYGGYGGYGKR